MDMKYEQFIQKKKIKVQKVGFDVSELDMNENLFMFQKHVVKRALKAGRFAIFADCGLGKTFMQLEWAKHVRDYTKKDVLILAPLAVKKQTIEEGSKFGIDVFEGERDPSNPKIIITNYDQLKNISQEEADSFAGVVLDESSILKSFTGKMRTMIIDKFESTEFKLACTATPSPNDIMEMGNHAQFCGAMSREEMLSVFFIHDAANTKSWRLKGHSQKEFYSFLSEWSVMFSSPCDLGFNDDGYALPPLNIEEHKITTSKKDNGQLFNDSIVNATNFNRELRNTMQERMELVASMVNNSKENFIVWIKQNEEGKILRSMIPDALEVNGNDKPETKESRLLGFAKGEFRVLITKTKIAQFGLNYQNCQNQIFASLDFSFEGLYQAIRRSYRFGQKKQVNIHLITTDTMQNVVASVKQKQEQFNTMRTMMSDHMNGSFEKYSSKAGDGEKYETELFSITNTDCVKGIKNLKSDSVGFSVFSPPFAQLYTYSDYVEDMGNCNSNAQFFEQFRYLVKEIQRVMMPGRNVAIHCMDFPTSKSRDGVIGMTDFSGELIKMFKEEGFVYHSRITIWKDPVVQMQRTKALGLLHKTIKKDSVMSRAGMPDYLLVFRADGKNEEPITHQDTDSSRNDYLPVDLWQKYASPVWMDINQSDTLQYRSARDNNDEKHICPLQLPVIERAIHLWSNENDLVLSPFTGIGSEGYQALKMGRRFVGYELKGSYYNLAVRNLKGAMKENSQLSLF